MSSIISNILARDSLLTSEQVACPTPGPDRDPIDDTSPLMSDLLSLVEPPFLMLICLVELTTKSKLYIADRNWALKRIWPRLYSRVVKFIILLLTGPSRHSFAESQAMVADRCNDAVVHTESLIVNSLESGSSDIRWMVAVGGTKEHKKASILNTFMTLGFRLLHKQTRNKAT
ncbi:hypothetical protein MJO28_007836 [Puccinia striiformis f. sp. tritici]|uniref:Uncharacterized protein n=2 Tax=Puccinia striiformis TaxID=27350 RepID=A0A2S4WLD4_9BASI|nr:hypothetical protein MJO28_007836 [Puccinia striiformis f. sp. tritici]POW22563.1 hypothetical protein PSHT_01039 [Puccinia striiformis]